MKSLKALFTVSLLFCCIFIVNPAFADEYWLLLDSSASLSARQATLRNESALGYATILLCLNPESNVGVIDFARRIRILEPTVDMTLIGNFIGNIGHNGSLTDIEAALSRFLTPCEKQRKIYLFTDGQVDVAPSRCVACPPTQEDRDSANRIITRIIPELHKQKNPPVINTVGLGNMVDIHFLQAISCATGGKAKHIKRIEGLLSVLTELWHVGEGNLAILNRDGRMSIDGDIVKRMIFIPRNGERIIPPTGSGELNARIVPLPRQQKNIIIVEDPPTGIWTVPSDVESMANIDIYALDKLPLGRKFIYQYEVLPFRVVLMAKNANQAVAEMLAQKFIKAKVIISGSCKESLKLPQTRQDGRKYWYEDKWWANCQPSEFPAHLTYAFFIGDNSRFNTIYPNLRRGIKMDLKETKFSWDIQSQIPTSLANFTKHEDEYFVSENIQPELAFQMPPEIVSVDSRKYRLGTVELEPDKPHRINAADIGDQKLIADVKCTTNQNQQICFKFKKDIKVYLPPFDIRQKDIASYLRGVPEWFKVPFTNICGLPEKIKIPFSCTIDRDQIKISARLKSSDFKVRETVFPVSLNKEDTGFEIAVNPAEKLAAGTHSFKLFLDSQQYFKQPVEYDFTFKVFPLWQFLIWIFLATALTVYGLILLVYAFNTKKGRENCTIQLSGASKSLASFPVKFFPPGRWEVIRDKKDNKVCRISRKLFGNGFCVKNYLDEKPELTRRQSGCKVYESSAKIESDNYSFKIVYQKKHLQITIEQKITKEL